MRGQESGDRRQEAGVCREGGVSLPVAYASGSLTRSVSLPVADATSLTRIASRAMFWFISLAVILTPIFAHGCHGDDVDHEPLLIPIRLNPENR